MSNIDVDKEMAAAHLKAAGWKVNHRNSVNPFSCGYIYVRDYRTNHTELLAVKMDLFEAHTPRAPMELYLQAVGGIMRLIPARDATEEDMGILFESAVGYLKRTQTYAAWERQRQKDARVQAIINIYPSADNQYVLHSACVNSTKVVLSADEVKEFGEQLFALDAQTHPEYFDPDDENIQFMVTAALAGAS